jgi:hypothetical protein
MPWRSAAAMFAGAPGGGLLDDALDAAADDAGGLFFGLSPRGLSAGASDWGTGPRLAGDAPAVPRAGGDAAGVKKQPPASKRSAAAAAPPRHADQAGLRCLDGSHGGACVRCVACARYWARDARRHFPHSWHSVALLLRALTRPPACACRLRAHLRSCTAPPAWDEDTGASARAPPSVLRTERHSFAAPPAARPLPRHHPPR